jgi:transmembrane sensor
MDEKTVDEFLQRYALKEYTAEEYEQFRIWLKVAPVDRVEAMLQKHAPVLDASMPHLADDQLRIAQGIEAKIDALQDKQPHQTIKLWPSLFKVAGVAAVLALTILGLYRFSSRPPQPVAQVKPIASKILPGGDKAILTLADGSQIVLEGSKNGVLARQGGTAVYKAKDGQILYDASKNNDQQSETKSVYNTISTPKGGQYTIVLPDGSKVWLNAATTLKFPAVFSGNERHVELNGEAYFEIKKNQHMPFTVAVKNTQIAVLGTHFNVMAYADENNTTTTLLEGAVKVTADNESIKIRPGQQAKVQNHIQVSNVDATEAIAWKNGDFNFSDERIESIMRKVSRWYNVEVVYKGTPTDQGFVGVVSRDEDITEVLNTLELTGLVHFKLTGRRLTVMP